MPSAAVLIGSPALGELAQRWVAAGLMGSVIHLDAATVELPMDVQPWQGLEGTMCSVDGAFRVRLQEALASEGALRGIVVAWVRDDSEDVAAGMRSVGSFAQRIIHQDTKPRLFDVVAPTRVDSVEISAAEQGWEQLVVVPEDRPELASPDAGWLDRREAVLLHVAAAALGRLGGTSEPIPKGQTAEPRAVSVWSRHGLGGETLRREATDLLDRRLPDFCAPDIKPRQYAVFAEQQDQAATMLDWLRNHLDGQLSYARPAPTQPILDPYTEATASGEAPAPGRRGKVADAEPIGPEEREARWRKTADRELHSVRKSDGAVPPSALWNDTVQLLTAAVDGGELPEGFERSKAHDHWLVVEPRVAGPNRDLTLGSYPEHHEDIPELISSPPEELAAEALADASSELWDGTGRAVAFPALDPPPRRHRTLFDGLVEDDKYAQKEQRERLLAVGLEGSSAENGVADTLWTRVMTDSVRSRLDAARWHKAAVADWPVKQPKASPTSLAGWILCALVTGFGAAWLVDGDMMNDLIGRVGLGPWDPIVASLSSFGAAILLGVVAFLLRPRAMDDGYWQWRMALRLLLKQRAEVAYRDARRLANAQRIYSYWWLVLRDIFPLRDDEDDHGDDSELVVPRALQHGPVEVHKPYRELVISQAGVKPGWRGDALAELAARTYSQYGDESYGDALDAAFEDDGYAEGALHRLQRDLPGTWAGYRASWIEKAVCEAKGGLIGPASRVGGEQRLQLLPNFLDEVRVGTAPTLWHALKGMEQGAEERITASTEPTSTASVPITATMPALASAVLMVLRPLRRSKPVGDSGQMGDVELVLMEDDDDQDAPY